MNDVCVVTGGGSGMGLSAALQMQKQILWKDSLSELLTMEMSKNDYQKIC